MTVADLIALLQTKDPTLLVAYMCCSEQVQLEAHQVRVVRACEPRADGWIQDERPDMPSCLYLLFPGN